MKLAIVGGRDFSNYTLLHQEVSKLNPFEVVSGGAKGCDTLARNYATENKLKITEFLPDYAKYGRGAPIRRNADIVAYADVVIAFWDGKSRGTRNSIETAKAMGKEVIIVKY